MVVEVANGSARCDEIDEHDAAPDATDPDHLRHRSVRVVEMVQ